jgi:hypothetical protein
VPTIKPRCDSQDRRSSFETWTGFLLGVLSQLRRYAATAQRSSLLRKGLKAKSVAYNGEFSHTYFKHILYRGVTIVNCKAIGILVFFGKPIIWGWFLIRNILRRNCFVVCPICFR